MELKSELLISVSAGTCYSPVMSKYSLGSKPPPHGTYDVVLTRPQLFVANEVLYACTIILVKLSILSLYNRIFPSHTLYRLSIGIGALVILYSLGFVLAALLQCIPLSKLWEPSLPGVCISTEAAYITTA